MNDMKDIINRLCDLERRMAKIEAQPVEQAEKQEPVAQCTNSDTWNCKYCRRTETCEALKDSRNFGEPPKREQEPVAWVDKVWVERLDISKQLRMELLFSRCQLNNNQIPLYTAPPKREVDMSTKPEKIDTSAERVHETDKSVHDDDDIQEYKKPWVGLTEKEIDAIGYKYGAGGLDLMDELSAMLKEKNT